MTGSELVGDTGWDGFCAEGTMPHMRWSASSMDQTWSVLYNPPVPATAPQLPRPAEERENSHPVKDRDTGLDPDDIWEGEAFTQTLTQGSDTNCTCDMDSSWFPTQQVHYNTIQSLIEQQKLRLHNVFHTGNETSQCLKQSTSMYPL